MAIQGILKGFTHPTDPKVFVALIGRGAEYQLIDSSRVLMSTQDLEQGLENFRSLAHQHCESSWHEIQMLVTNSHGQSEAIPRVSTTYGGEMTMALAP